MTLALALIFFGLLLMYGGIKGLSVRRLLLGNAATPSQRPASVERPGG